MTGYKTSSGTTSLNRNQIKTNQVPTMAHELQLKTFCLVWHYSREVFDPRDLLYEVLAQFYSSELCIFLCCSSSVFGLGQNFSQAKTKVSFFLVFMVSCDHFVCLSDPFPCLGNHFREFNQKKQQDRWMGNQQKIDVKQIEGQPNVNKTKQTKSNQLNKT